MELHYCSQCQKLNYHQDTGHCCTCGSMNPGAWKPLPPIQSYPSSTASSQGSGGTGSGGGIFPLVIFAMILFSIVFLWTLVKEWGRAVWHEWPIATGCLVGPPLLALALTLLPESSRLRPKFERERVALVGALVGLVLLLGVGVVRAVWATPQILIGRLDNFIELGAEDQLVRRGDVVIGPLLEAYQEEADPKDKERLRRIIFRINPSKAPPSAVQGP